MIVMQKYTLATRLLHHGSVLFIVALWALASFESLPVAQPILIHKSLGVVFLIWVLARLVNLAVRPKLGERALAPAPKWQTALAHLTHSLLYLCMLLMPITGILMSFFSGRAVAVFGLFELSSPFAPDRAFAKTLNTLHTDVVFPLLVAMIGLHIAAVIYHQWVLKDNVLYRMK